MAYDFIRAERNNVVALYIVNPEILEMDGVDNFDKPFLFQLAGGSLYDSITQLQVYVGGKSELEGLVEGRKIRNICIDEKSELMTLTKTLELENSGLQEKTTTKFDANNYPVPFSLPGERKADIFKYLLKGDGSLQEPQGVRTDLELFKETLGDYDALHRSTIAQTDTERIVYVPKETPTLGLVDYLRKFLPFL